MSKNKNTVRSGGKKAALLISLAAVLLLAVGLTLAYIFTESQPVQNTFNPTSVTVEIEEKFDGAKKSNVTAKNTGDSEAYIRIKLVTYRVNEDGDRIGGEAVIPEFTPGDGWFEQGGFYYYEKPVKPDKTISPCLIGENGITLQKYTDADGGKQVVEVLAEAIQSTPTDAVVAAWEVGTASKGDKTIITKGAVS